MALLKTIIPRQILADIAAPAPAPAPASTGQVEAVVAVGTGEPAPLSVTLKGLRTMQTAAKATVLYAPPVVDSKDDDGSGGGGSVLYKFCDKLRSTFQDAGLMEKEDRPLLLHATILNTIYVKGKKKSSAGGKRERLTIDARQILDRYGDHVWLEDAPVEKIAICKMGAKKLEDGDEAYEVEAEIDVA